MPERDAQTPSHDQRRARYPSTHSRLTRQPHNRILGGVASGVATFVGAPISLVRSLFLASLFLTGGLFAVAYLLLWLLLPAAP